MKKCLIIFLLFYFCSALFAVLPPDRTLDELIAEAQSLFAKGMPSGHIKKYFETEYPTLTEPERNDIVNYAENPGSQAKPVYLIYTSRNTGAASYSYYSPTGLSGLVLSAVEGVSARSKALGGAFSTMHDDPNLVFRNSAGIVQDKKHSMSLVIGELSLDSKDTNISSTSKVAGLYSHQFNQFSFGGSFVYIYEQMIDFDASSSFFSLQVNAGKEFFKGFTTGLKFKLNNFSYTYYDKHESKIGVGADLGLAYNYQNFLSAGLSFQSYNVFKFETYVEKIPSQIIFGASVRPIGNLITLLDVSYIFWSGIDNDYIKFSNTANIHIGLEYSIIMAKPRIIWKGPYQNIKQSGNVLSFRTGVRTETTPIKDKKSRTHFTIGAGYKFSKPVHLNLGLDFASDYISYSLGANYKL